MLLLLLLLRGEKGVFGTLEKTSSEEKDAGLKLVGDVSEEEEEESDDVEDDAVEPLE